jgi:NADP-dependent 3-hydroxy acid dehydrogenase YdfG
MFERRQVLGAYGLARILFAFRTVYGRAPVTFDLILTGACDVLGTELLRPAAASAIAFAKVAPQEHVQVKCRVIDIETRAIGAAPSKQLASEISQAVRATTESTIALRGPYWWAQAFAPIVKAPEDAPHPRLKPGGVYLVTGGLGHIGLIAARRLAAEWKAKLILVGRSDLETKIEGKISPRLEALEALRELGAEVAYVKADLSVLDDVIALRTEIQTTFGALNGLVFCAGTVTARAGVIEINDLDCYAENYAAKVHGLRNVLHVFGDDPLDFAMVLSSISTVLGGSGLCAYSAANHIADLLIQEHRNAGNKNWTTTNWDVWAGGHFSEADQLRLGRMLALAIEPEEGAQAFEKDRKSVV